MADELNRDILTPVERAQLPQLRDDQGRFIVGTRPGPGNTTQKRVAQWRQELINTVTVDDIHAVILKLVEEAKKGKRWAVVELLDRCLGRQHTAIEMDGNQVPKRIVLVDTRTPSPNGES